MRKRPVSLREHIEDTGEQISWNADAVIADTDHRFVVLTRSAHHHDTLRRRVLGGIENEVGDDLLDAHGIGVEDQRLFRYGDGQRVLARIDEGAGRIQRIGDGCRDIDGLLAKLDGSSRDARDFEQVVEQSRQKTHLAIDGLARLVDHRVPGIGATDDLHGDLDRRERVAQLVREHGEKLVLGLVRRGEVQERLPMLVRSEALVEQGLDQRLQQLAVDPEAPRGEGSLVADGPPELGERQLLLQGKPPDEHLVRECRQGGPGRHGAHGNALDDQRAPDHRE